MTFHVARVVVALTVLAWPPRDTEAGVATSVARSAQGLAGRWLGRRAAPEVAEIAARRTLNRSAQLLVRHGPGLIRLGSAAARVAAPLSSRNARRLAILAESGALAKTGRSAAICDLIERRGDQALDFVWRHKGAMAVAATLTAFLADPDPFLAGTRQLVGAATGRSFARLRRCRGERPTRWSMSFGGCGGGS